MIHDPLLNIDNLITKAEKGSTLTEKEWKSIRNDMNDAVCFLLRLQERGALENHQTIKQQIALFLNSR